MPNPSSPPATSTRGDAPALALAGRRRPGQGCCARQRVVDLSAFAPWRCATSNRCRQCSPLPPKKSIERGFPAPAERPRSGTQGPDSIVRGVNDTSRKGKDGISLTTRKTVPKTPVPGSCFSRFILLHHCRPPGLLKFQNCLSGDERSPSWNGRTTQACPAKKMQATLAATMQRIPKKNSCEKPLQIPDPNRPFREYECQRTRERESQTRKEYGNRIGDCLAKPFGPG